MKGLSRRAVLKLMGATVVTGFGLTGYAFGYEPLIDLSVAATRLTPPK